MSHPVAAANAPNAASDAAVLSIRGVHLAFASRDVQGALRRAHVLNGVELEVAPGRIVGLIGETGAGDRGLDVLEYGLPVLELRLLREVADGLPLGEHRLAAMTRSDRPHQR